MIPEFSKNRSFIENEFEEANFDLSSGMNIDTLSEELVRFYNENQHLPSPILRAKCIEFILANAQIEINPRQIFADKMNIGVNYHGFAGADIYQSKIATPRRHCILTEQMPEKYKRMLLGKSLGIGIPYTDFWHTVPDWNRIISMGFCGFIDEAKQKKAELADTADNKSQRDFYDSVIISFEAAIHYVKRLYQASLKYNMPEYSACLDAISKHPPENTYELLEYISVFLNVYEIGWERARTFGSVDRLWKRFIENDIASGRFTKEEICEMLRYFFIRMTAAKRFAEQPIQIGGADENGNTYCNDITRLILDVYDEMNIFNPKIHVRVHKSMPEDIFTKCLDMIRRGNSSLCLLNDEVVIPGLMRTGVSRVDASEYVALGCYEPVVMGKEEAQIGAAWINLAKPLEYAIFSGFDVIGNVQYGIITPHKFESFEDFLDAFFIQLDDIIDFFAESYRIQDKFAVEINPTPFFSATMSECTEKGIDVHEHPLTYNNVSFKFFALATVVDSLVTIKKYVFDKKSLTIDNLREILRNNWDGHEALRLAIRKGKEKYGNNCPLPDELMSTIIEHITSRLDKTDTGRGGKFRVGLDSITNCIYDGGRTGATPDGRKKGDPTSRNLCAVEGQDRGGITSLMNSLLKLDHTKLVDSAILDFILHPSAVAGKSGLSAFCALVKTYFARGGFGMQGNIVSREMLTEAKDNPDKFSTLQIRVCGWNEYFVHMSEPLQDKFIAELTK